MMGWSEYTYVAEMSISTSRFANVWSQMKQIGVIFTHLKLCVAITRHDFKWVKKKYFERNQF